MSMQDDGATHPTNTAPILASSTGSRLVQYASADPAHFARALTLYPAYFDARFARGKGRRVAKSALPGVAFSGNTSTSSTSSSGDELPLPVTCWYLAAACDRLGFGSTRVLIENGKRYPRHPFGFGRIRVLFDKSAGHRTPRGEIIRNKRALMRAVAGELPGLMREHWEEVVLHARQHSAATGDASDNATAFAINAQSFRGYDMDPQINQFMRYGYGAVPEVQIKGTAAGQASASGSSASSKKHGKGRK